MDGNDKKRVIYCSMTPLSRIAFRESGLEYLQSLGHEVMVWVIGGYDNKLNVDCFDADCDQCEVLYISKFGRYEELVKKYADSSVFYTSDLLLQTIYAPLCKYKCRYVIWGLVAEIPCNTDYLYEHEEVPCFRADDGSRRGRSVHDLRCGESVRGRTCRPLGL